MVLWKATVFEVENKQIYSAVLYINTVRRRLTSKKCADILSVLEEMEER